MPPEPAVPRSPTQAPQTSAAAVIGRFREEARRLWSPRATLVAVIAYSTVLAVQWLTASYGPALLRSAPNPGAQSGIRHLLDALNWLGLVSPLPAILGQAPLIPPAFRAPLVIHYLLAWFGAGAFAFVMPAFAARSLAPERRSGRVKELLREGLTARQILGTHGLAATCPFLVMALLAPIVSAAAYPLVARGWHSAGSAGYIPTALLPEPWVLLLGLVALPVTWALQCGIQVCLSALSRRLVQALLVCYLVQLAVVPMAGGVFSELARRTGSWQYLYAVVAPVIMWAIVFALLQKLALLALPGSEGPPGTIRFRGRQTPPPNGKARRRTQDGRRAR